jgi:hypothetical protein
MKMSVQRRGRARGRFLDSLKVAPVATLLFLAGCGDVDIHMPDVTWDGDFGEVSNTDHEAQAPFRYEFGASGTLSLSGVAGTVEIVGSSDAPGIVVEGVRRVRSDSRLDARTHLSDLRVEVRESAGTLFVQTRQPMASRGRVYEVEYRIEVPSGSNLSVVQASGPIEIRSVHGDVGVTGVAGTVTLVDLTANVRASVVAGSVDASVALLPNGVVELRNSSGDIRLSVPTETSASLSAATTMGAVRLVDLTVVDQDPRASVLRGTMADGDGTIRLETISGDITIQGR